MKPELFDEMLTLEQSYWWLVGRRRILGAVIVKECARRPSSVRRWVDVGSGTGVLLSEFSALVEEVVGVENNPTPFAISRARGVTVVETLAEQLPSEDESVGMLATFEVLEHLDDDVLSLEFAPPVIPYSEASRLFRRSVPA